MAGLALLLAGSAFNLAKGVQQVFDERERPGEDFIAAAGKAARLVRSHMPEHAPLAVVVHQDPQKMPSASIVFYYQINWRLYPWPAQLYTIDLKPDDTAGTSPLVLPEPARNSYRYFLLYHPRTQPRVPIGSYRVLASRRRFLLVEATAS